jgi:hypothetical protein
VPFLVVAAGWAAACGTGALTAKGGACFQAIDCQLGLVCIAPMGSDAGVCTDDLTNIVDLPPEAGADAVALPDGTVPDSSVPDTGTPDTGKPDTGTPDTGTTPDTGSADSSGD